MKSLVVGFLFNESFTGAVLIRKNRPDWQVGLLNGVGGHVEPEDEDAHAAMQREAREELNIDLPWTQFADVQIGDETEIGFFYATSPNWQDASTVTDELIEFHHVEQGHLAKFANEIPNLRWLIPMAINHAQHGGRHAPLHVYYQDQQSSQEW